VRCFRDEPRIVARVIRTVRIVEELPISDLRSGQCCWSAGSRCLQAARYPTRPAGSGSRRRDFVGGRHIRLEGFMVLARLTEEIMGDPSQ
jgi:hypothetical protein